MTDRRPPVPRMSPRRHGEAPREPERRGNALALLNGQQRPKEGSRRTIWHPYADTYPWFDVTGDCAAAILDFLILHDKIDRPHPAVRSMIEGGLDAAIAKGRDYNNPSLGCIRYAIFQGGEYVV